MDGMLGTSLNVTLLERNCIYTLEIKVAFHDTFEEEFMNTDDLVFSDLQSYTRLLTFSLSH